MRKIGLLTLSSSLLQGREEGAHCTWRAKSKSPHIAGFSMPISICSLHDLGCEPAGLRGPEGDEPSLFRPTGVHSLHGGEHSAQAVI